MTRSIRTRLRRAIGLGLALGVVIAPNALAKPYIGDSSGGVAAPASQSAGTIATTHDTWGADMRASQGAGTIAATHDTWGADRRPSAPSATIASSGSHETRNVLLAASGIGLLLIGGGSLFLMLRRRRAQLA